MRIKPTDKRAPFNLGLAYKKLDPPQTAEALTFFRAALKITPNDAKTHVVIASTYEAAEPPMLQQASDAYMEAYMIDPSRYKDAQEHAMKLQWQAVEVRFAASLFAAPRYLDSFSMKTGSLGGRSGPQSGARSKKKQSRE